VQDLHDTNHKGGNMKLFLMGLGVLIVWGFLVWLMGKFCNLNSDLELEPRDWKKLERKDE